MQSCAYRVPLLIDLSGHLVPFFDSATGDDDFRACFCKSIAGDCSDAARSARNDGRFPGQIGLGSLEYIVSRRARPEGVDSREGGGRHGDGERERENKKKGK